MRVQARYTKRIYYVKKLIVSGTASPFPTGHASRNGADFLGRLCAKPWNRFPPASCRGHRGHRGNTVLWSSLWPHIEEIPACESQRTQRKHCSLVVALSLTLKRFPPASRRGHRGNTVLWSSIWSHIEEIPARHFVPAGMTGKYSLFWIPAYAGLKANDLAFRAKRE